MIPPSLVVLFVLSSLLLPLLIIKSSIPKTNVDAGGFVSAGWLHSVWSTLTAPC